MTRDHINMLLNVAITASNTQVWTVTQEQLEKFAELVVAAALEEKPIAWMQRLQPEPPVETHNRITSVEEVAKEWDNPIPLYARKGDGTELWGIPDHERQAVCAAHYASEQQAIRARGKSK